MCKENERDGRGARNETARLTRLLLLLDFPIFVEPQKTISLPAYSVVRFHQRQLLYPHTENVPLSSGKPFHKQVVHT